MMNDRILATLAMGLVLGAVATGCTVHTYSGASYPGTTFRSEPTRYEVPYHARSHERDRDQGRAPDRQRVRVRPSYSPTEARDHARDDAHGASKPTKPSAPSAHDAPREHGDSVVLLPAKPAKPTTSRRDRRSFKERLGELVEQKNEQLAEQKKKRAAR